MIFSWKLGLGKMINFNISKSSAYIIYKKSTTLKLQTKKKLKEKILNETMTLFSIIVEKK